MDDLATYLLDLIQNSITAKATRIVLTMIENDQLKIILEDNGCGMNEITLSQALSPFYTTRTKRKVGLGLPMFKMAAEATEGTFMISSEINRGTVIETIFNLNHIDMIPIGNLGELIYMISIHQGVHDFCFKYQKINEQFEFDLQHMKSIIHSSWLEYSMMTNMIEYINQEIRKVRGLYEIA